MVYRVEIFREDTAIVILQSLKVSHLSNITNRVIKLKNWMRELCTFLPILSHTYVYACVCMYGVYVCVSMCVNASVCHVRNSISIMQFAPESPRYLVLNGKEEEAKKILAMIAKTNCRPPLLGRLVTQEEKEEMLDKRNQLSYQNTLVQPSSVESGSCPNEIEDSNPTSYITQPNKEETVDNNLTVMSSDSESDNVQLLVSDEHVHRQTFSKYHLKRITKQKAVNYYHWFLLLFKNGWWKTTILLWYIW